MRKPNVCVLQTDGTNCNEETSYAFEKAGGLSCLVHINELRNGDCDLRSYQILALPGGFSYGDDVVSGKILAVELLSFLGDQIAEFVAAGKLIIGICNGDQVLMRTGLLPSNTPGTMQATLTDNDPGGFHCGPVTMRVEASPCVWTAGLEGQQLQFQMAHGEGRFYTEPATLALLEKGQQIPLRYITNPNGSLNNIAGVCDPTGRIFGLMPHPERSVDVYRDPNWRRIVNPQPHGLPIFENGVSFAAKNL